MTRMDWMMQWGPRHVPSVRYDNEEATPVLFLVEASNDTIRYDTTPPQWPGYDDA